MDIKWLLLGLEVRLLLLLLGVVVKGSWIVVGIRSSSRWWGILKKEIILINFFMRSNFHTAPDIGRDLCIRSDFDWGRLGTGDARSEQHLAPPLASVLAAK